MRPSFLTTPISPLLSNDRTTNPIQAIPIDNPPPTTPTDPTDPTTPTMSPVGQAAPSNLDPTGPAHPSFNQAYSTAGNPASKNPAEQSSTAANTAATHEGSTTQIRSPTHGSDREPVPTSLGRGVHGAPPGEEAKGLTAEDVGAHNELDGEQMRASGEGDVAAAVDAKRGATGAQPDLASDLDRKKAQQAPMREHVKEQRAQEVDVGGVLGQRGGPANPVGKGNYPNSGD